MKKLVKLLLCAAICLPLFGCGSSKKGSDEFAEYAKTLPAVFMESTGFDTNFFFDHPEKYGIKKDLYTLQFMTLDDFKKQDKEYKKIDKALDDYDYDALTKDQKITYDVLKAALKDDENDKLTVEDRYYLTTNYFDVSSGIQSSLPFALWNYEFKNQKSLDSFIAVLNQAPKLFKKYAAFEVTRQKKGYGMSKTYMDNVIKSVHAINNSDQSYILNATYEKIDNADYIPADKKQFYKDTITNAFNNKLLPAFKQTETDLSNIKILKKGDGELASYKGGKKYYESIVTNSAGVDSMKKYTKYLDDETSRIQNRLMDVVNEYPELASLMSDSSKIYEAINNAKYTDLTDSTEVIHYLEQQISDGKDFPKIKKLHYQMNIIPESMKETTTAAAAYYVSAFDDNSGKDENMILNGSFSQNDFTSVAHESFPGHMYQHNYFKTVKHNVLRDLLSDSTYTEGWATYIQGESCKYTKEPGVCELNSINDQLTYLYFLELDKKIHYDGYSREKAYAYLKENFGITNEEDLKAMYEQLLESPAVFTNYYVGLYQFLDLKEDAKDKWGSKYSDYRFHKAVLDLGPLPMNLLRDYMKL